MGYFSFISAYGVCAVNADTLQQQQKACYLRIVALLEKLPIKHKEVTLTEVGVIGVMADYLVAKMGGYL